MLSKIVPLHGSFMVTAIVGFIISALYVYGQLDNKTWGFTFMLFFAAMFIASMISMTYAPIVPEMKKKKR
jgi:type III secretory pathway component EscS